MKKLIMKLLGLESLVYELNTLKNEVLVLADENKELKTKIENLENEVSEFEIPDFDADDFVREDDVNDRIESYLNDNDYVTQSYCDDEIESKVCEIVDEKVDEAVEIKIEDLDLESKVKKVFNEMDKASFGDTEELRSIVRSVLRDGRIKFE